MPKLRKENANGYDEFQNKLSQLRGEGYHRIWILFCGSLDESGRSWCPDCTRALPVIDRGLNMLEEKLQESDMQAVYIFVSIERNDWKGNNSSFRQDEKLKLTAIPTVIHLEGHEEKARLNDEECSIPETVCAAFSNLA